MVKVEREGDRVIGLKVDGKNLPKFADADGCVRAKRYIDASGHAGFLRRAMGVTVTEPTSLKNIAIWRYWQKPIWADTQDIGKGGVRVRVLSLGNGWIWFIPISPDRVSVGFVTHADHYKESGLLPAELYERACSLEPHVRELLVDAVAEGPVQTTKDWSFLADRMAGENWMLVGESAGFADPILAGGMSLAMVGAREAAYILAAVLEDGQDEGWLTGWYSNLQSKRISQHIKFADYWYLANGHFLELKEHTSKIAAEAGLELNPEEAFRWLAAGGFVSDDLTFPVAGTYRLGAVKSVMQILSGMSAEWEINRFNKFLLNLDGCETVYVPYCSEGKIQKVKCFQRGTSLLPMIGMYKILYRALVRESDAAGLVRMIKSAISASEEITEPYNAFLGALEALEGMLAEGWVTASVVEGRPFMTVTLDEASVTLASV